MLFFCNVWIQIKIKQMWKAKTEIDGPAGKSIKNAYSLFNIGNFSIQNLMC
jgi:hypothetical protein